MRSLCNDWEFTPNWFIGFEKGEGQAAPVRLPHTVQECSQHYADHNAYQMVCGYRRKLELEEQCFISYASAVYVISTLLLSSIVLDKITGAS